MFAWYAQTRAHEEGRLEEIEKEVRVDLKRGEGVLGSIKSLGGLKTYLFFMETRKTNAIQFLSRKDVFSTLF
jgi:hypothetical protein